MHATFRHEALLYEGADGFLDGTVPLVREAIEAREPVMVAVLPPKIALMREALGDAAADVAFADMEELGRNPSRIIPAWQAFLAQHERAPAVRGIGEPIWAGRSSEELVECQIHEALINVAFADAAGFRLVCPYDAAALDERVLHEACRSHPELTGLGASASYSADSDLLAPFDVPLPPPRGETLALAFDRTGLDGLRRAVRERAARAGLDSGRADDLVLAANELACNSVRHGGGHGVMRMWEQEGMLACEVADRGHIEDPLAGRRAPDTDRESGWGLWIAHHACDLVQVRSRPGGTASRLFMRLA